MTWSTNDGVASTVNLSHSSGAETMFIRKRLLKNEGWTVLSSSDGTTYNASGDQITSSSSGANGMDNSNAWFRIEDPGSLREYVFQRGAQHYSWKWLYSASDGFTGGSPDATTIPTATDEQGLARNSTTFQTMFATTGSWKAHIAAQDVAHNGVYAWWACCAVSGAEKTLMFCDAIDSESTSGDADPCVHYGSDDTPLYATLGATIATSADNAKCWMLYGETLEEWSGVSSINYYAATTAFLPNNGLPDPYDSDEVLLPIHWFRHASTGAIAGVKGTSKYIRWNPKSTTYAYQDLFLVGTDYWLVWTDLALPGWPNSTLPTV